MADDKTFYTETTLNTVPKRSTLPASVTFTADKYNIQGTDLKRDLQKGDWIVDMANFEIRQVKYVNSDTEAELFVPFTNSGTTDDYVSKEASAVIYMELIAQTDTLMNGSGNLRADIPYSDGQPNASGSAKKLVKPKIVDGATGAVDVNLTYISNKIPPQIS
jgi:hypothetical protein